MGKWCPYATQTSPLVSVALAPLIGENPEATIGKPTIAETIIPTRKNNNAEKAGVSKPRQATDGNSLKVLGLVSTSTS